MKGIICLLMLCFTAMVGWSQTTYNKRDYSSKPLWIAMMNDTSVNYHETVRAFRAFFKRRALPKEPYEIEYSDRFEKEIGLEEEEEGMSPEERKRERAREKKRQQKQEARSMRLKEPTYAEEVRAFRGWFFGIQPWVREDGSIVGPQERQAIIDAQKKELSELERSNRKN